MVIDLNLVTEAANLARKLHAGQKRKSSGEPVFLAHLVPVSQLVQQYGGTSEEIAASLLHDSIEDCEPDVRPRVIGICGANVLALVEECTEPGTGNGYDKKAPWRERKEGYLQHVSKMSSGGLRISLADKTQQVEELAGTVETKGDAAYSIFKEGKESTLWFFEILSAEYHNRVNALELQDTPIAELLERFNAAVERLV